MSGFFRLDKHALMLSMRSALIESPREKNSTDGGGEGSPGGQPVAGEQPVPGPQLPPTPHQAPDADPIKQTYQAGQALERARPAQTLSWGA